MEDQLQGIGFPPPSLQQCFEEEHATSQSDVEFGRPGGGWIRAGLSEFGEFDRVCSFQAGLVPRA